MCQFILYFMIPKIKKEPLYVFWLFLCLYNTILQAIIQHICTQAGMIRQFKPPSSPAFLRE